MNWWGRTRRNVVFAQMPAPLPKGFAARHVEPQVIFAAPCNGGLSACQRYPAGVWHLERFQARGFMVSERGPVF